MSFREKSAWACLVTTLIVFVPYFTHVFELLAEGRLTTGHAVTFFVLAVAFMVLLNVVAQIGIVIVSGRQPKDERDAAIESTSIRYAYFVLASTVGTLIFVAAPLPPLRDFVALSQALFFCFVLAETVRYLTQVVCYRRGV
jgi:hypothetical protein